MTALPTKRQEPIIEAIDQILDSLGLKTSNLEKAAESDAYRIDFEQNFTVELQQLPDASCRVSARIFSLGKSLQVQDNQLVQAMQVFTELQQEIPQGISLAISDHDNCLRLCLEIVSNTQDFIMAQFNDFVQIAFAYKHTYFKHKGLSG